MGDSQGWALQDEEAVAVPGILFRGSLKKFNKKRTWKYWVTDKNNNNNNNTWSFTISFYKYSNFELLYDSLL